MKTNKHCVKTLAFFLTSIILLSSTSISAHASEESPQKTKFSTSNEITYSSKQIFAEEKDELCQKALADGKIKIGTSEEINHLMEEMTFAVTSKEKEDLELKLAEYGIYVYKSEDDNQAEMQQARVGSGDVKLSTPVIFYESWEKTWTVTCGGNWTSTNWNQLLPGNVGGSDAFGVGYTNTKPQYHSSVVRSYAYISDGGDKLVSTNNRSDGDGSKGFGFKLQDYIYLANAATTNKYVGYKWYGSSTYDANFSSYSGVATAYYIHTYKSASVTSVSFGVNGKTAGINATIAGVSNSFTAFSNDKTFGVY